MSPSANQIAGAILEEAVLSMLGAACRVSTLFPTPVPVLFPTFSVLNYKTHPVIMSITLFDNHPLSV